jgi:hypothetical protein
VLTSNKRGKEERLREICRELVREAVEEEGRQQRKDPCPTPTPSDPGVIALLQAIQGSVAALEKEVGQSSLIFSLNSYTLCPRPKKSSFLFYRSASLPQRLLKCKRKFLVMWKR